MVSEMATRIMGQTTANCSFDCRGVLEAGLSVLESKRDRAVLSVLWGCGLRR